MTRPKRTGLPVTVSRIIRVSALLGLFLAALVLLSLSTGATGRGFFVVMKGLLTGSLDASEEEIIIYSIRLPRLMMAGIIGAALAVSGTIFQALLRNPLADPYVLGVSGGSATGAIIGILIGAGSMPFGIPGLAFCGGVLTIFLVFGIAKKRREIQSHNLLLAGVIVNAFFSAVILFLMSTSGNAELHNIMFWLMGDLGTVEAAPMLSFCALLAGFIFIYAHARDMNLLVISEESAMQLGVNVKYVKAALLVAASLLTGLAVSMSGIIGFVGLIIPHIMRLLFGSDHRLLLPASMLFGAAFLIAADTVARTILAPNELPVGVITALFGAPFFVYLLRKKDVY